MTLEPPSDLDHVSSFLNIRVADIGAVDEQWSARGAEFLTPPIDRGSEIRCYMRERSDAARAEGAAPAWTPLGATWGRSPRK